MTGAGCPQWLDARERPLGVGARFGIMGIINVTPDSFYDGGEHCEAQNALAHARNLLGQGAAILDVGAESTRPGADPLNPVIEIERLQPVLENITALGAPVSVDTWHAKTAAFALERGAAIINDVSACAWDDGLADVLAQYKPGYVLTHAGARPKDMGASIEYGGIVEALLRFFSSRLDMLVRAGLPEDRIVLDPGIGFGKSLEQNLSLLHGVKKFLCFGRPLLVGLSMKSMFGALLGLAPQNRGCATSVASALLWEKGVFWHRVHDVGSTKNALDLAVALAGG